MTTDDYSFCQEESTTLSEGNPPPSNSDRSSTVPSTVLHPTEREHTKLDTILDLLANNHERSEGNNTAACIVELVQANERLVQANERLSAQVMKSRDEILRLRQENDALKVSAELKSTVEKLMALVNRNELVDTSARQSFITSLGDLQKSLTADTKNEFEQLILAINEKHDAFQSSIFHHVTKKHDEIKSSIAALQENLAAVIQEKLQSDQQKAGVHDTSNHNTNVTTSIQPNPPNSRVVWKNSKSHVVMLQGCDPFHDECDILDCSPLMFGNKYKWSIKVVSTGGFYVQLGVASTIHKLDFNQWLGFQKGGWSYDSGGFARHANKTIKSNLPEFKSGSKLTFLLDLTGNGTLSVYHDDDASNIIDLFDDMKSGMNVSGFPLAGFVPAASCYCDKTKIEFLGFEDI